MTPPPMASRCIRADTGLQQKIPLGALVLDLGRRTAPPQGGCCAPGDTQENTNRGTVVAQSHGVSPLALFLWNMFMARTNSPDCRSKGLTPPTPPATPSPPSGR